MPRAGIQLISRNALPQCLYYLPRIKIIGTADNANRFVGILLFRAVRFQRNFNGGEKKRRNQG